MLQFNHSLIASLSELDKAVDKAVECATNEDKKGLKSAMELIGRLMVKQHETPQELLRLICCMKVRELIKNVRF